MPSTLWALTTYFNPAGYARRRANYRVFRRHLGLPLLAIEWSPDGRFELDDGDAERLVRVDGGDVLWQKERLINLALRHLPPQCRDVALVDCDVVFERPDWARAGLAELAQHRLVQPFDRAVHLERRPLDELAEPGGWRRAAAGKIRPAIAAIHRRSGGDPAELTRAPADQPHLSPGTAGFAWMAGRELLETYGLPDTWVMGYGDLAFFYGACGLPEHHIGTRRLSPEHARHFRAWAAPLAAHVGARISYVPGALMHLWHGELADRGYDDRFEILHRHGFDPARFLEADGSGVWRLTDAGRRIAPDVKAYFARRREDGRDAPGAR